MQCVRRVHNHSALTNVRSLQVMQAQCFFLIDSLRSTLVSSVGYVLCSIFPLQYRTYWRVKCSVYLLGPVPLEFVLNF